MPPWLCSVPKWSHKAASTVYYLHSLKTSYPIFNTNFVSLSTRKNTELSAEILLNRILFLDQYSSSEGYPIRWYYRKTKSSLTDAKVLLRISFCTPPQKYNLLSTHDISSLGWRGDLFCLSIVIFVVRFTQKMNFVFLHITHINL